MHEESDRGFRRSHTTQNTALHRYLQQAYFNFLVLICRSFLCSRTLRKKIFSSSSAEDRNLQTEIRFQNKTKTSLESLLFSSLLTATTKSVIHNVDQSNKLLHTLFKTMHIIISVSSLWQHWIGFSFFLLHFLTFIVGSFIWFFLPENKKGSFLTSTNCGTLVVQNLNKSSNKGIGSFRF